MLAWQEGTSRIFECRVYFLFFIIGKKILYSLKNPDKLNEFTPHFKEAVVHRVDYFNRLLLK